MCLMLESMAEGQAKKHAPVWTTRCSKAQPVIHATSCPHDTRRLAMGRTGSKCPADGTVASRNRATPTPPLYLPEPCSFSAAIITWTCRFSLTKEVAPGVGFLKGARSRKEADVKCYPSEYGPIHLYRRPPATILTYSES